MGIEKKVEKYRFEFSHELDEVITDMYIHREEGLDNPDYQKFKYMVNEFIYMGYDMKPYISILNGYIKSFGEGGKR